MRSCNSSRFSIMSAGALCLWLLCSGVLSAQGLTDKFAPSDILILKYKRSLVMERYLPRNWENSSDSYPRRSYPMPGGESLPSTEAPMKRMKVRPLFIYSVEIENIGRKKIAAVVWEYVFIGTGNDNEFARLQFRNRVKVAVNKTALLTGKSLAPPPFPKVTNVRELEREEGTPYRERAEIKCVLYADGSWWRHPQVIESDCESLVSDKNRKQR